MSSELKSSFIQFEFEPYDLSEIVDPLFVEFKSDKKRCSLKFKMAIELVVANIIECDKWVIIPLGKKNQYVFKNYKISALVVSQVVHFLKRINFIYLKIGFKDKIQKATRIKARKKFKIKIKKSYNSIIIKNNKKIPIVKYNRLLEHNLRLINNYLSEINVTFHDEEIIFKPYHRVFNNSSFKYGGRFFGHPITQSKKVDRKHYKLDGRQIIEVDFINFAINYLYQKENKEPHESYIIKNYLRKDVKKALNTIINASSKTKAKRAIFNETDIKDINLFIKDIEDKHEIISKYFYSGIGLRIQKIESRITEDVLIKSLKRKIKVFPLHDAFLTTRKFQLEVARMMQASYRKITGQKFIEVKIKRC